MGLFGAIFGKNSPEKQEPSITDDDKKWVDVCFKWLIEIFEYPVKGSAPFLFNENCFPATHKAKKITAELLTDDLCGLLSIDRDKVSISYIPDIRDIPQTPHSIHGKAFESVLEVTKNENNPRYIVHIANSLLQRENLLLSRLLLELVEVKLYEKLPVYGSEKDFTYLRYIAVIFFGFGILLSKSLITVGMSYTAGWQQTWKSKSEVPYQVVAYALAVYTILTGDENPAWKDELPSNVKNEFGPALALLLTSPREVYFNKDVFENELKAKKHFRIAEDLRKSQKFEDSIKEYEAGISLASDKNLLSLLYGNSGYACLMQGEYEKSLFYYNKALEIRPGYAYCFANIGYIYVMTDQLDKAKEYLDKVDAYDKPLAAYLLRDWALYYMKRGEYDKAEEYFQKAFNAGMQIDLLEYFYAKYLFAKSENEEAMRYLDISVSKGERQGIELMATLKK